MAAVPKQVNGVAAAGGAIALGMVAIERIKREWELAADALPQLICLIDQNGKVIRANRTLERWGLAPVTKARGLTLHDALHGAGCAAGCRLRAFCAGAKARLQRGKRVKRVGWDARLERHISIVIQPQRPTVGDVFAIAAVEDIGQEEEQRRRLIALHVSVREEERRRVARDLHDALGQSLNVLKLSILETARRIDENDPRCPVESLRGIALEVQRVMSEVRNIAMDLRPSTLDDLGLIPTLSWLFREIETGSNLKVERSIEVTDHDIAPALKIEIYRILQEAISNALRHAGASAVSVRLYKDLEGLHVCIQDDGCGFNGERRRGLGLLNMRERAESLGGRLSIESERGKGTRLTATWPRPAPRRAGKRQAKVERLPVPAAEFRARCARCDNMQFGAPHAQKPMGPNELLACLKCGTEVALGALNAKLPPAARRAPQDA